MLDKNAIVRIIAGSESLGYSEMGTGFLFGEKYILTCNHVVDNNSQIKIQFTAIDGGKNSFLQVNKVIGVKEDYLDYAILEISKESLSSKPLKASCLHLTDTEEMQLSEGLFVQLAGHTLGDRQRVGAPRLSFYMTPEREITLGTPINNGFYLFQKTAHGCLMQDGFSGSPVLDIRTSRIFGILDSTTANRDTTIQENGIGQMIRSDAIKLSLKEYDEQYETNFCDLLFTREELLDTPYIHDNCTKSIQTLAKGLDKAILFIGPGINLYDRNNLEKEELERISNFNNQSNRSLSEIELAYFLEKQIKKKDSTIKCLQAEIPELKDQAISPCSSCPYKLGERPEKENCSFRLENNSQDQTNNQLSIEEQLMDEQVNVQFLSQYYSDLCDDGIGNIIEEIKDFYAQSQPNDAHKLIAKYVKNEKIKLIITTNCDDLLERAFSSFPANIEDYGVYSLKNGHNIHEDKPLICLRKPKNADAPIILKLHGCYKLMLPHNLLITKSNFLEYYSVLLYNHFEKFAGQLLDLNGVNLTWLNKIWFVGYTLNDPDINLIINIFKCGLSQESQCELYWVYCPSSSLNQTNRLWNEYKHLKLVPRTLESFFNDLEHFYGLLN